MDEEGDLFGDSVNVAARLETLADPGGIYLSQTVYSDVKDKVPQQFDDLGAHRLKNMSERVKVYPLSQAGSPPSTTTFTDAADIVFDSTIRCDVSFFASLDRIVQSEPWLDRDRAMIDVLRSLGIEKGKPFNPDAKTKAALENGIREAHAWLEAKYHAGLPRFYDGSHWTVPALPELLAAVKVDFNDPDKYPVDARGLTYSFAYIGIKRLGAGQFYLISIKDKDGNAFDGSKTYRLHVPANPPVEQY